jgi:hypothetical protein
MSLNEEITKLKNAVEKLKQISDELKISELVAQLRDVIDDLHHYVMKDAEYFSIRQAYNSVKVHGRYFELYVDKASLDMPIRDVYNAFFNNTEIFLQMMKQAIALLHDVVEMLARRLDITSLMREVEQTLARLQG